MCGNQGIDSNYWPWEKSCLKKLNSPIKISRIFQAKSGWVRLWGLGRWGIVLYLFSSSMLLVSTESTHFLAVTYKKSQCATLLRKPVKIIWIGKIPRWQDYFDVELCAWLHVKYLWLLCKLDRTPRGQCRFGWPGRLRLQRTKRRSVWWGKCLWSTWT